MPASIEKSLKLVVCLSVFATNTHVTQCCVAGLSSCARLRNRWRSASSWESRGRRMAWSSCASRTAALHCDLAVGMRRVQPDAPAASLTNFPVRAAGAPSSHRTPHQHCQCWRLDQGSPPTHRSRPLLRARLPTQDPHHRQDGAELNGLSPLEVYRLTTRPKGSTAVLEARGRAARPCVSSSSASYAAAAPAASGC
jgi:hypothetical protein